MSKVPYVIPKEDGDIESKEDYAERIVKQLCDRKKIRSNAKLVRGCNIIESDFKFLALLDEGYKSFVVGLYHSTVALSSMATERLCYDLLENSEIKFNGRDLEYEQKKSLFNIPFAKILEFLRNLTLITSQMEKDMFSINNLRNKYIHPILGGEPYEDAKKSINLLCKIIDSLTNKDHND